MKMEQHKIPSLTHGNQHKKIQEAGALGISSTYLN